MIALKWCLNVVVCMVVLAWTALAVAGGAGKGFAPEPIRVLLITGQQNHDWSYTSQVHKQTLEATGRFKVDVTTTPGATLADAATIKPYQVFFLDYNGVRWGDAAEKNFLSAVTGGTGVVCVHASNNSFIGWTEYEKMVGLVWIEGTTGHGKFHAFDVNYSTSAAAAEHPIIRGLASMKAHPDELYHTLVNTQHAKFTVLASAMSSSESGGTGKEEPMALVSSYGKGRVFHTPLGHVWPKDESNKSSINDPQFKVLLTRGTEWAGTGAVTLPATMTEPPVAAKPAGAAVAPVASAKKEPAINTLTDAEKAGGWILLFDGKTTDNFRGFKKATFPEKGWSVDAEGVLHSSVNGEGGDIITKDQYEQFEFSIDWKVTPKANSGVIYLCSEENFNETWETGLEMQILDNTAFHDGKITKNSAGALYDMIAASKDTSRPVGEWNTFRILKKGTHVEQWFNEFKVVEFEFQSPEFKKLVAESKWKDHPSFGKNNKGHIALQTHGGEVMYRNIKIRTLPAPTPEK